jgi:uncharacterized protein
MALADERCMLLTTFKRDGTPVATPVWLVPLGDRELGFYTSSKSGKAKRLRHTDRVIVQASSQRGAVKRGSAPIEATARLVQGEELERIRTLIIAKYGVMAKIARWAATAAARIKRAPFPYGDRGVIVTLPVGAAQA